MTMFLSHDYYTTNKQQASDMSQLSAIKPHNTASNSLQLDRAIVTLVLPCPLQEARDTACWNATFSAITE